jgi:hypothetical protein
VALHGTDWTDEQLAAVMDGWAWLGDPQSLEKGFTLRLHRPMRVSVRRATSRGDDDLFVAWPADQFAPR